MTRLLIALFECLIITALLAATLFIAAITIARAQGTEFEMPCKTGQLSR
jgi:hypothetical protein